MPDLMKTPSNRRYVVNFQQKEPLNKYDIWLSFNKHEQSGHVIVDSEHLADKDLVFKIYMNGKWVPILGIPVSYEGIIQALEELDKKKMNIVPPTEWEAGDIAIFQQGSDECDQLVSGGTLEEMLQTIINGGGAIPIQRATTSYLGGVKADVHHHESITDQYIEAKFKNIEGAIGENDRLYVSASEIVSAINNIGGGVDIPLMGPDVRGGAMANLVPVTWEANRYIPVLINQNNEHMYINGEDVLSVLIYILENDPLASIYEAGEGIDITENVISNTQATDIATGGVRVRQNPDTTNERRGAEIMYGNGAVVDAISGRTVDNKHLCVDVDQIVELVTNQESTDNPIVSGERGIAFYLKNIGNDIYRTYGYITGVGPTNIGKYLKVNSTGTDIEWDIPSGGQTYPALAANTVAGTDCVVTAPIKKDGFLRGDGEFVAITTGSTVTWNQIWNTGIKIAQITIDNNTTDIYAPNSIYYGNNGITVNQNTHYIGLDLTGVRPDYILSYNGTGIEWIPQLSYTAGVGIEITSNNTINSVIEKDNNSYEATSSLVFNCVYASAQHPSGGISMIPDNTPSSGTTLDPYTYTEVTLKMAGLTEIDVQFNTATQLSFMKGDPVYIMFDLAGKNTQINISVPSAEDKDWLINVNNAVITNNGNSCLDITNYSRFLCTLQFGTVKIEPLEATVSQNDNNNSQEEP